jgi:hypothetical protein
MGINLALDNSRSGYVDMAIPHGERPLQVDYDTYVYRNVEGREKNYDAFSLTDVIIRGNIYIRAS